MSTRRNAEPPRAGTEPRVAAEQPSEGAADHGNSNSNAPAPDDVAAAIEAAFGVAVPVDDPTYPEYPGHDMTPFPIGGAL